MASLVKLLSVGGVLVVVLGWLLYEPIPEGYKKPWQVHLAYLQVSLLWKGSALMETLGLGTFHGTSRILWNTGAKLFNALLNDGVKVEEAVFDGVRVVIYSPPGEQSETRSPGLVYIHGGAWITGSPETYEIFVRRLVVGAQVVVVSVDYRLAPEHVFPAAFDDCVAATIYLLRNADKYGVDPTRVAISGDSVGGALSASVTLRIREMKDSAVPPLKLQLLLYPLVQGVNLWTPSVQQNVHSLVLSRSLLMKSTLLHAVGHQRHLATMEANNHVISSVKQQLSRTYLNTDNLPKDIIMADYMAWDTENGNETVWAELGSILMDPYHSPLFADDLTNLPKAYIMTCENDVLRDGGFWYSDRLRDAGCDVTHRHHPIAFHGIINTVHIIDEADQCAEEIIFFIRNNI